MEQRLDILKLAFDRRRVAQNIEEGVLVDGKMRCKSGFPLSLERGVFGNNTLLLSVMQRLTNKAMGALLHNWEAKSWRSSVVVDEAAVCANYHKSCSAA